MPTTTDLPVGDLFEFIGDFALNGDGPPTTGRMALARLQQILLSGTSAVGAKFAALDATDGELEAADAAIDTRLDNLEAGIGTSRYVRTNWTGGGADVSLSAVPAVAGGAAEVSDGDIGTHPGLSSEVGYDAQTGRVPNAGSYAAIGTPPAWRRSGDTIATTAAKKLAASIALSPLASAPTLQLTFRDPVTNLLTVLSPADTKSFIQGYAMDPVTYSSEPPGLTGEYTSKVILPPDDQRKNFQVQCETHDFAINWNGREASFARDPIVFAGAIPDWSAKGKEAVSVILRPSSLREIPDATIPAKLWVSQDRLVPGYISGSLFGDQVLSAYPDQGFNKAYRGVLRDRINILNDLGIFDKLSVFLPPIHTKANLSTNPARPRVPMVINEATGTGPVGQMLVTPYKNFRSTGPAAYIDTGLAPDTGLGLSEARHFIGVQVDGTALETATGIAGNSPNYYIKPNATASLAGFKSGDAVQDSIATPAGGWVMGNRIAADTYDLFGEGEYVAKASVLGTPGVRNLFICAINSANGPTSPSVLPVKGFVHGIGLQTRSSCVAVREAFKAIFAAADAASGV